MYKSVYKSPRGTINMRSDGEYLTGLWFPNSRDEKKHDFEYEQKDLKIFDETKRWLDIYILAEKIRIFCQNINLKI